jgi:hypothetical protein
MAGELIGAGNELVGAGAKVFINNYVFDVIEGGVDEDRSLARGDTTGTGRYKVNVVDKQGVSLNIKAIRKSSINPHAASTYIARSTLGGTNDYAAVKYFPNGDDVGDDTKSWRFNCVWSKYSESFNAQSGLVNLTAAGESTGSYKRPGDT